MPRRQRDVVRHRQQDVVGHGGERLARLVEHARRELDCVRVEAVDALQRAVFIIRDEMVDLGLWQTRQALDALTALLSEADALAEQDDLPALFRQRQEPVVVQRLYDTKHKKPPYMMLSL